MTQNELAKLLNVKQNTISQWELGIRVPRADFLLKLAEIFNCTVDELLRDDDTNHCSA